MTPRTRRCEESTIAGRLRKAEQFLDAAETIRDFADDERDVGDALVTLCVRAHLGASTRSTSAWVTTQSQGIESILGRRWSTSIR
jgi:hypothetical protein